MPKGIPNKQKHIKEEAKMKVKEEIKALNDESAVPALGKNQCNECSHFKAMHYGGVKDHCNTPNCPCLEFK